MSESNEDPKNTDAGAKPKAKKPRRRNVKFPTIKTNTGEEIVVYCAHTRIEPINLIKLRPNNPNKHPDKQVRLLAEIFRKNGIRNAIAVSDRSGLVTKGAGRYAAAFEILGMTHFPIDVQHYDTNADELADVAADNQIAELSETDDELLSKLAKEIEGELGEDFDAAALGFEEKDLAPFLADDFDPKATKKRDRSGAGGGEDKSIKVTNEQFAKVVGVFELIRKIRKNPELAPGKCLVIMAEEYETNHKTEAGE